MNRSVEEHSGIESEREIYSAEEANQILEIDPKKWGKDKYLLKVFGETRIQKMIDVLQEETLREIDFLYLTGELSKQTLIEYALQMPEYHDARKELLLLADEIAEYLAKEKLDYIISKLLKFKAEVQEWQAKNPHKVMLGVQAPYDFSDVGFVSIFMQMDTLLSKIYKGGDSLCRILCGADFVTYLKQRFALLLKKKIDSDEYSKGDSVYLNLLLQILEVSVYETCEVNSAASIVIDFKENTEYLLDTYKKQFKEIITKGNTDLETSDLKESADLKFLEIETLAIFRRIEFCEKDFGDSSLQIYLDDVTGEASSFRALQTCIVRIAFDKNEEWIPPEYAKIDDDEFGRVGYRLGKTYFECILDRSTGSLNLCNSSIPVSVVMSDREYYLFKNLVFDFILEYLRNKEEDIDEYLAPIETEAQVIKETREKIKPTWVWNGYESSKPEEEDLKDEYVEAPKKFNWGSFPAISKKEFIAALDKILGGPLRCKGTSHYIYKGRNNKTVPVPYGTEDIFIGLLRAIVKNLAIDPQELRDAL